MSGKQHCLYMGEKQKIHVYQFYSYVYMGPLAIEMQ